MEKQLIVHYYNGRAPDYCRGISVYPFTIQKEQPTHSLLLLLLLILQKNSSSLTATIKEQLIVNYCVEEQLTINYR